MIMSEQGLGLDPEVGYGLGCTGYGEGVIC